MLKDNLDGREKTATEWHSKAVKLITKLTKTVFAYFRVYGTTSDETRNLCLDLANLRGYYLYAVLDATKETAPSLINLLVRLQKQAAEQGDRFHTSFFFTLSELLRVKYEMGTLGDAIKRQDFERNFNETMSKYGLGQVRKLAENEELVRKAGLTRFVVREMTYSSPLPPELKQAYCYTVDGGHSVIVVLENEYRDGEPVERFLVPAPVRTVLRHGYKIKDGYVWCNIPYSKELGLLAEEDFEF